MDDREIVVVKKEKSNSEIMKDELDREIKRLAKINPCQIDYRRLGTILRLYENACEIEPVVTEILRSNKKKELNNCITN